ncbi:MAG: hypothetical protein U9R54_02170, partial [Bacteroidota bacterium]|nr:hypothetical protein [Bacteroidota bacterium]
NPQGCSLRKAIMCINIGVAQQKQGKRSTAYGESVFESIRNSGVQYGFAIEYPCGFKDIHDIYIE